MTQKIEKPKARPGQGPENEKSSKADTQNKLQALKDALTPGEQFWYDAVFEESQKPGHTMKTALTALKREVQLMEDPATPVKDLESLERKLDEASLA